MGQPSKPNALETEGKPSELVGREPSYPDRARIDSDVRAFLRPASSPWIVFDRDSRIDDFARSALRVGAVFASSPSFREDAPAGAPDVPVPLLGPMVVAVTEKPNDASPLAPDAGPPDEGSKAAPLPSGLVIPSDASELRPAAPKRTRPFALAGACLGLVALLGISSMALSRTVGVAGAKSDATRAQAAVPTSEAPPVSVPIFETPGASLPLASPAADSPHAAKTSESDAIGKMSSDPKKRFGRLTIKADGKTKTVWFDGKRMLGAGTRSFMVFCGMHTVAVNEKSDAKDIEVPCNGEYVAQAK